MAVEIPVVIDIDKAFDEAAKRVDTAMKPFKAAIEDNTAKIQLKIGTRWDDLSQTFVPVKKSLEDIVGLTSKVNNKTGTTTYRLSSSMKELATALDDAKAKYANLTALQEKGLSVDVRQLDASREAITILMSEMAARQRKVTMVEQATRKEIEATAAIERGNYALIQEAKTAAELNDKIAALSGKLQHLDPKSAEWANTAKALRDATVEGAKLEASLKKVLNPPNKGKVGSIERIRNEMQALVTEWDSMSARVKFDKDGQLSAKAKKLVQDFRNLSEQSERYGRSLQATAAKAVPAIDSVSQKLRSQSGIFRMITSYMSIYTAFFAGMRFIRNVRETTAEFEMQRVALGGIIQDAERANSLFREIKAAAIESPFQIKDLVRYTKQLSAYRIETEDLFKVTMKLADVSAGLGVDMNRLILAYGQVRAAAVLRGQELRQFTEAGIPLVELLAKKFQELGREGTTTADVFELISKRAVPFSMIADIFDDMTERGGVFYKMQEKQAETLKGQWSNLKDALSIMYDEIGNTTVVHGAMTSLINDAKFLFQNWRYIANAIKLSAGSFAAFKIASMFLPNLKRELTLSKKALDAFKRSQELSAFAAETGSKASLRSAIRLKTYSVLMEQAAMTTNWFKRAWLQLKAAMIGTSWISLLLTALSALATVFASIIMESGRLNKELQKIGVDGETSINRSIANFKRLADAASNATDGSKEQADAINELKRTYGDIIPSQNLEVEKLRELKGNYDSLTLAIRQKISEQIREQQVNAITDYFSKTIGRRQGKTKDLLSSYGLDKEQINAVMSELQEAVRTGLISVESTAYERRKIFQDIIKDLTGFVVDFGSGFRDLTGKWQDVYDSGAAEESLNKLTDVYLKMEGAIRGVDNSMEREIGTFGKFAKMAKEMEKAVANVYVGPEFGDKSSYASQQQKIKETVGVYWDYIVKAFDEANKTSNKKIDIGQALLDNGEIDFGFIADAVDEAMSGGKNTRLNTFINSIQESYEKLIPSDRIVNLIREKVKDIAEQFGVSMDKAQMFFKDSETSMEDWVKGVQDAQKTHTSLYNQMVLNNKEFEKGTENLKAYSKEELNAEKGMIDFLNALITSFGAFQKNVKGPAYQQDPFIKQMQDRMKFMQDFRKGYEDLQKYMSSSAAAEKEAKIMLNRGLSMGIDPAEQRRAAEDLSKWYKDTMDSSFEYLKKEKGVTGTLQEFLSRQITGKTNRDKMLRDFQSMLQSMFDAKTDFDTSKLTKDIDDALKRVTDEIKRSETARNFYNNILDMTGDEELSASMAVSVYGGIGDDFKDRIQRQLVGALNSLDPESLSGLSDKIKNAFSAGDYDYLVKHLAEVPEKLRDTVKQVAGDAEKYNADWVKDIVKTYEKTKEYDERITTVRKREAQKRSEIQESSLIPQGQKESLITSSNQKEAKEIADIELERLKNTYEWTQAFKDLERVSTNTLKELIKLLDEYIEKSGPSASPEALKAATQAREQAQEQIVSRDAYSEMFKAIGSYTTNLKKAKELRKELNTLEEDGKKDTKEYSDKYLEYLKALDSSRDALKDVDKSISAIGNSFNTLSSIVSSLSDMLDFDELSDGKAVLSGIATGLGMVGTALVFINAILTVLESNPIVLAISAIIASVVSLGSVISNLSVAKADREIEHQRRLLDDLEDSYSRLADLEDKVFGSEFIHNYTQRLATLRAEIEAYKAQAAAEESKGKKSDEDKIRDYEKAAKDAARKIEDMQSEVSEKFFGSDLTSAARDFASAWVDAYKEFGSTTDAISERFQDMIQNMIVESMAAKIVEKQLRGVFDTIDELSKDGQFSITDAATVAQMAQQSISSINIGMSNLMSALNGAGLGVRTMGAGLTGISKSIATASEESILGLAAGINTQNFYMQQIHLSVMQIKDILTAGAAADGKPTAITTENIPYYRSEMFQTHMTEMHDDIRSLTAAVRSVITPKTASVNTHVVAVK